MRGWYKGLEEGCERRAVYGFDQKGEDKLGEDSTGPDRRGHDALRVAQTPTGPSIGAALRIRATQQAQRGAAWFT